MAGFHFLSSALVLSSLAIAIRGSYVITTPRQWQPGNALQVCVQVLNPRAPAGVIVLSISHTETISQTRFKRQIIFPPELEKTVTFVPPTSIRVPPGMQYLCESLSMPRINETEQQFGFAYDDLSLSGTLDGSAFKLTREVLRNSDLRKIVVQTDKFLYRPGQTVQFRVITINGPLLQIATKQYPEIYVVTPSGNRIAQWLDVDNSKGLIHLSTQLADEPEEGQYSIKVKLTEFVIESVRFKVEEYVLPRFEVTVEPPKYVLATDNSFSFTACAEYTFGQPVTGDISWEINNQQNYACRVILTRNDTISGCSEITVSSADIRMTDCYINRIKVTATVVEEGTGAQQEGEGTVFVSNTFITFKELRRDDYLRPNLPYTLEVLAKYIDGAPAAGEPLEICHGGACKNVTTPLDGILKIYLTNQKSTRVVIKSLKTRALLSSAKYSAQVKPFFSPSNSSLMIYAPEKSLKCQPGRPLDYVLPVLFSATNQKSAIINVQVMARSQVQYWKSQEYTLTATGLPFEEEFLLEPLTPLSQDSVSGMLNIPLTLPPTASPQVKVLVWYVRTDGEVVAATKDLKVEKCLQYDVGLDWSANVTQPGDQATLVLSSEPNSLCSLGIVDKSVELLSDRGNSLTVDSLFDKLANFEPQSWFGNQADDRIYCRRQLETEISSGPSRFSYFSHYVDALHVFDASGLYVFSDLDIESRPCQRQELQNTGILENRIFFGNNANRIGGATAFASPPSGPLDSEGSSPRTDFPETWLWDLVALPSSGVSNQELTLPDTITEWVGKAVCVHPQKGIGLSKTSSITTFTPFFIDLTLPPSIKRGEIFPLKISIFNYLQQSLPLTVILENNPEFDVIEITPEGRPLSHRVACVGAQDVKVLTVKIRPTVIGQVNLTVSASVNPQISQLCHSTSTSISKKSDALTRSITVEAEGFIREQSWSKYICAEEIAAGADSLQMTELSIPLGMVEGSERAWVTAVGDLLAISLQNLGSLIRMPYGCGEQNLLNFAPNIFIMKYLEATKQETPESTEKLLNFMRTGYQRQLLYRHRNGSYSAFGRADESGSTWLTAFVLKSFAQAQQYILIDKESLNVTKHWLIDNYGQDTCAISIGKVFNKGMTGGVGARRSSVPLTAYILISLLESGLSPLHPTVERASQCLLSDVSRDPYTLALKAYGMSLKRDPNTPELIMQLLAQAVITSNSTYWELTKGPWRSNSLAVETAGYAILAMMKWDAVSYEQQARKIVKWISAQRNGRGGFYSTQDTVVALQALSTFELHLYQGDLNVVAQVQAQGLSHSFSIKESNKLLQQMVSLPTLPTNVSFTVTGQGCAVLQTVVRYNDPEPEASDAFSLRVNTRTEPDRYCNTKRISACAAYLLPDGISNMAVIEVNLVSGYIPEKKDLKKLLEDNPKVIKRYDIDGSKLSFYIEEFTSKDVCVNFRVIREVDVEDVKQGSVVVYDYYQPEFSISKTYNLPASSECRSL